MKITNVHIIEAFVRKHVNARKPLQRWVQEMEDNTFKNPVEIRERWADASFLPNNHIVFNIKGNHYRLLVEIIYIGQTVVVLRVGTHKEYDTWNR